MRQLLHVCPLPTSCGPWASPAMRPVPSDVRLLPERLSVPLSWKKPRHVFVNSMSDLFHHRVPFDFVFETFDVMRKAGVRIRGHVFQVLTKRPGRAVAWWDRYEGRFPEGWPPNIWIGTSVESQKYAPRLTVLGAVARAGAFRVRRAAAGTAGAGGVAGSRDVAMGHRRRRKRLRRPAHGPGLGARPARPIQQNQHLVIDELKQLNLHPQYQAFFMQEVRKIAGDPATNQKKKVVFLITHSPFILDLQSEDDLKSVISFDLGYSVPRQVCNLDLEMSSSASFTRRLNAHHKQLFLIEKGSTSFASLYLTTRQKSCTTWVVLSWKLGRLQRERVILVRRGWTSVTISMRLESSSIEWQKTRTLGLKLRLRALTDAGNSYDIVGRYLDALDCYERALRIDPSFGMALGNRGLALLYIAPLMGEHKSHLLQEAAAYLDAAIDNHESVVRNGGQSALDQFERRRALISGPPHPPWSVPSLPSSLGDPYLDWCLRNELFLHASPSCIRREANILDPVFFQHVTSGLTDEDLRYTNEIVDAFNTAKQTIFLLDI